MEHIGKILKKQTPTGSSKENTDTWSSAEEEAAKTQECQVCKGARFVHPLLPSGKPDYSRTVPCRCVKASEAEGRQSRLKQYSNLGSLARFTFENLMPEGRSSDKRRQEQFARTYKAARVFVNEPKGWLVFGGPSGSGKTHLAAAIANERIRQGQPAFYITAPDLLDRIRASLNAESEMPYDEFFEQVRSAPLLVLDDLGVQSGTPWAKEKLDQLLTSRFNNELPTVIVTGTPIEQIEDRLRTRLTDPRVSRVLILEEESPTSTYSWAPEFELQKSMTFVNYKRRTDLSMEQQDNMDLAYRNAFDFAKNPDGWLVFMGETGCGKTHLASAIVNYRYEVEKPALFIVVSDFLEHLRAAFNPESKVGYDEFFEKVKTAPLLVLDDLAEHSMTSWVKEKLYQIFNYRYNARLPTVITTQYSLDQIMEKIDPSISSRLADRRISVTFNIIAPDFRTERRPGKSRSESPRDKMQRNR